jgi:adenosylcobyric acid synthase
MGTYLHNIFHNDTFRNNWLNMIRKENNFKTMEVVNTEEIKEQSYEKLAEIISNHLDMDYILKLVNNREGI